MTVAWLVSTGRQMLAGLAWVRVDTGHHRWRDVIAGTAVSWSVSKLFVTPFDSPQITPIIGPKFVGLQWEHKFGAG